jgi:glucokinase
MDLGGTKLLTGVVDSDRKVLHESRETSRGAAEDEIVAALIGEIEEAREARPDAIAAGIGIPCTIDRKRGVAINAVNLEITDVPIRDLVGERTGLPIYIDNDANLAALAEHRFGVARGADNAIMLTIGTGIGGGLILSRDVYRGTTGAAAELGHVVVDENGPPCQGTCPNRGCVETMASGTALARDGTAAARENPDSALAKALQEGPLDGRAVTEAARAGDAAARKVVAAAGRHLGVAMASLANIFDPDLIVVGGGVSAVGDLMLDPAREELASRALPPMNRTQVRLAAMGPDAGMIGAATMALEETAASA